MLPGQIFSCCVGACGGGATTTTCLQKEDCVGRPSSTLRFMLYTPGVLYVTGGGVCDEELAILELLQPENFKRVIVLLYTLAIKDYTSLLTRNSLEIECGKSRLPIFPREVIVGTDERSLLKFSFTMLLYEG